MGVSLEEGVGAAAVGVPPPKALLGLAAPLSEGTGLREASLLGVGMPEALPAPVAEAQDEAVREGRAGEAVAGAEGEGEEGGLGEGGVLRVAAPAEGVGSTPVGVGEGRSDTLGLTEGVTDLLAVEETKGGPM